MKPHIFFFKFFSASALLVSSLPLMAANQVSSEVPIKASAAVDGQGSQPSADNAVISGINTFTSPTTSDSTRYGLYGEATDPLTSSSLNESAGVFGRGFGSYAFGVKGIAGDDLTGIYTPIGAVGVVGLGSNRGIVAGSITGTGLFARSGNNYGVWGESSDYRGITGRTARSDNNYGFYTPDNIFSFNYQSPGYSAQIFRYSGDTELFPGDVVSFSGIQMGGIEKNAPIVTVNSTTSIPQAAIAGVVLSRFDIEAVKDSESATKRNPTPKGSILPGQYVLVVIRGPAAVNVDSLGIQAEAGSLLVSQSDTRRIEALSPAAASGNTGQTIGVLLGELSSSKAADGEPVPQVNAAPLKTWIYVSPR